MRPLLVEMIYKGEYLRYRHIQVGWYLAPDLGVLVQGSRQGWVLHERDIVLAGDFADAATGASIFAP